MSGELKPPTRPNLPVSPTSTQSGMRPAIGAEQLRARLNRLKTSSNVAVSKKELGHLLDDLRTLEEALVEIQRYRAVLRMGMQRIEDMIGDLEEKTPTRDVSVTDVNLSAKNSPPPPSPRGRKKKLV